MADGRINKDDVIDPALQKEIDNITASLKKMADQLGIVTIEASKLNTANSEGVSSTQKRKEATDNLSKAEKQIADYSATIAKTYDNLSEKEKQLTILKQQASQASKELKDKLIAENIINNEQAGTLEKLAASNKLLAAERQKLNITTDEGKKRLIEINAKIDENNKKIIESSDKLKQNKMQVGGYSEGILQAKSALGQFSGSTGDIIGRFSKLQQSEGGIKSLWSTMVSGIGMALKAGLAFLATPLGAAIAVLAVSIAAVSSYLEGSNESAKKAKTGMAELGAVMDTLWSGYKLYGKLVIDFWSFDFKKAGQDLKEIVNITSKMGENMALAASISKRGFEIAKSQNAMTVEEARIQKTLVDLKFKADDVTRKRADREKDMMKYIALTEQLEKSKIILADKQLVQATEKLQLAKNEQKNLKEVNKDFADALAGYYAAQSSAEEQSRRVHKQLTSLQLKDIEDRLNAYLKANERIKASNLGMLEADVLNLEEGSKEQLDSKLKLLKLQEKYELQSTATVKEGALVYESKTAGEREKIEAEYRKKRFDLENSYNKKIQDSNAKVFDERIKNIGTSLETLSKASDSESLMIEGLANEEINRQRNAVNEANISTEDRKKLLDELNKYENKINEDREKRAEKTAQIIIQEAQREAKEKLEAAKGGETAGGGEITDEEALGLQRFLSAEAEKINALNINADKKKELIDKLKDIEKAADDEIAANNKKNLEDEVKDAEKAEADKIKAKKETEQAAGEFVRSALDFVKSGYEEESQKYETEKNYQLSILEKQKESGSITEKQYQDKKTKIENDAAIKQAKVKRKAAEMDKVIALSGVVQHTAVALMKAAELGPIFGPIYAAIVVATAALQTASIIKQPLPEIPKFKEGTTAPLGKSTLAWVGDGNERELITHPDGSMMLSPDKATLSFLPKGATVTPMHRLNKQMRGIEQQMLVVKEVEGWKRVEKAINKMANSIPGQSTTFVNVTGENLHVTNRYRR